MARKWSAEDLGVLPLQASNSVEAKFDQVIRAFQSLIADKKAPGI
jgi:hypothetical protein